MAQQLSLKRAKRSQAFLKMGIASPSGGGKTLGALLVAYGLMKKKYPNLSDEELWSKIAIIDTENGSGELYVGLDLGYLVIGEYNAVTINPPFTVDKYLMGMKLCEDNAMEVCIIDSSTHLWSAEGGLLEQQNVAAKRSGNSYTAWRDITPLHNQFVNTMLQCNMHVIATMRSKQEYVQEKNQAGKTIVKKLGLEPEQRKGMEYEFTVFFDVDQDHMAYGSKDRTSLFDNQYFKISPETGETLMGWLLGADTSKREVIAKDETITPAQFSQAKQRVVLLCKEKGGRENPELMKLLAPYKSNPNNITDYKELIALEEAVKLLETVEPQD